MKWKEIKPGIRLKLVSAAILAAGLVSAAVVYVTAEDAPEDVLLSEYEGSKAYIHDLELFGGKANVLAVEFSKWFTGLWHGRSLAYTIAVITVLVSLVVYEVSLGPPDD